MTSPARRAPRATDVLRLFDELIDARYTTAVRPLLAGFALAPGSELDVVLRRLEDKADALSMQGGAWLGSLTRSLEMRDTRQALTRHLREQRRALDATATRITSEVVRDAGRLARALTLGDETGRVLPAWNRPSARALGQLVEYTQKDAWWAWLDDYPAGIAERITATLTRDFAQGLGPIASARHVRELAADLPRAVANNKLRTLQLTAMRDATAFEYKLNERLIDTVVRIAAFDSRVCPACLALHGSELRPGERVDGHYQCRCTSVASLKGRPRNIPTGDEWLRAQSEARQRDVLGNAVWRDWAAGRVNLRDYVVRTRDPVFGDMIRSATPKHVTTRGVSVSSDPSHWTEIEHVERWARARWPNLRAVDLGGMTTQNARETFQMIDTLDARYPGVVARLESITMAKASELGMPRNYLAAVRVDGRKMYFNPTVYAKDLTELSRKVAEHERMSGTKPWSVGGVDPRFNVTHEFGHLYEAWLLATFRDTAVVPVVGADGTGKLWDLFVEWRVKHKPTRSLSQYALASPVEAFAEAFTQRELMPRDEWHPFTRELDELLGYMTNAKLLLPGQWRTLDADASDDERRRIVTLRNEWNVRFGWKAGLPDAW